jgi:isopenicillin N synthase-like dioxygenase
VHTTKNVVIDHLAGIMSGSIPVIDLSNPDREKNARELAKAMETIGFVYFDNIPGYDDKAEEALLGAIKWFFALPLEKKMQCAPDKKWKECPSPDKSVFKGYYPCPPASNHIYEKYTFGDIAKDDPRVSSGIPFYELTPIPKEEEGAELFYSTLASHQKLMEKAGMEAARLLAIQMGFEENFLANKFLPKSCTHLRALHYPLPGENSPSILLRDHTDTGFITLLTSLGYNGLQIRLDDGTWVDVISRPGTIVVNIGDALESMSKGRFKATRHRVQNRGEERYSVPVFFLPSFDSKFELYKDGQVISITYGPWAIQRLKRFSDFQHLPDF